MLNNLITSTNNINTNTPLKISVVDKFTKQKMKEYLKNYLDPFMNITSDITNDQLLEFVNAIPVKEPITSKTGIVFPMDFDNLKKLLLLNNISKYLKK